MDGPLKELSKLEKLTAPTTSKAKGASLTESLDYLLQTLADAKSQCEAGPLTAETVSHVAKQVEAKRKDIDDRQKDIYSSIARIGKALDKAGLTNLARLLLNSNKKFPTPLPSYPNLFADKETVQALERVIALHLLRTGQFETAQTFLEECEVTIPEEVRQEFVILHDILKSLRNQDITPALKWAQSHRPFLKTRGSPLEFHLHRSQFIRLLLSSHPPHPLPAIEYARMTFAPFWPEHSDEIQRLTASVMYLPLARLQKSPYPDLASPSLHFDLEPLFAMEYCANLGMSKQLPLRVVGDIGAGGALAKIEKGRRVMRERKSEWSQTDELPIEIPLHPENRYHSTFTCPVSKEQSTEQNPPMLMTCGHVISKDSLQKLSKPGGRVKCPYCPTESLCSSAIQVYF